MFWTIVLIGAGLSSTSITYVGQFEQQETCAKSAQEFKAQNIKAACVQAKSAEVPMAPAAAAKK